MTAQERARQIASTGRTVAARVVHPERGEMQVQASCALDAALFPLATLFRF